MDSIDSIDCIQRLEESGFSSKQAKATVKFINTAVKDMKKSVGSPFELKEADLKRKYDYDLFIASCKDWRSSHEAEVSYKLEKIRDDVRYHVLQTQLDNYKRCVEMKVKLGQGKYDLTKFAAFITVVSIVSFLLGDTAVRLWFMSSKVASEPRPTVSRGRV